MISPRLVRLSRKVTLVTGASSGLGRAIALAFASHGAKLVVCADLHPNPRNGSEGESVATHEIIREKYGKEAAQFVQCDVGNSMDMKEAVHVAVRDGQRLDVIVNNAGVGHTDPTIRLHQLDEKEWDRMMRINATGTYNGCKHALAQMIEQQPDANGLRGRIINVSSVMGLVASTGGAGAYNASKAASINLTKQIALDYAKDRIVANALCPGLIRTAMTRDLDPAAADMFLQKTPWGEWLDAGDVAGSAVFLASDDSLPVTGVALPVDGGYVAA